MVRRLMTNVKAALKSSATTSASNWITKLRSPATSAATTYPHTQLPKVFSESDAGFYEDREAMILGGLTKNFASITSRRSFASWSNGRTTRHLGKAGRSI